VFCAASVCASTGKPTIPANASPSHTRCIFCLPEIAAISEEHQSILQHHQGGRRKNSDPESKQRFLKKARKNFCNAYTGI
jgi:hypothetical protein